MRTDQRLRIRQAHLCRRGKFPDSGSFARPTWYQNRNLRVGDNPRPQSGSRSADVPLSSIGYGKFPVSGNSGRLTTLGITSLFDGERDSPASSISPVSHQDNRRNGDTCRRKRSTSSGCCRYCTSLLTPDPSHPTKFPVSGIFGRPGLPNRISRIRTIQDRYLRVKATKVSVEVHLKHKILDSGDFRTMWEKAFWVVNRTRPLRPEMLNWVRLLSVTRRVAGAPTRRCRAAIPKF